MVHTRRSVARRGLLTAITIAAVLLVMFSIPAHSAPGVGGRTVQAGTLVYLVQMLDDPIVAYDGGRPGLPATRPRPGEHVNPNSADVRRYQDFLDRSHADALAAVGTPASAKFHDYAFSFNGFAAVLTPAQATRLAQQPNVVAVDADERRQPLTDNTPTELGLTGAGGVWATGGAGGSEAVGEDVIIGVIDTGIWPEHPSFSDQTDFAFRPGNAGDALRVYDDPPAHWHGICQSGQLWSQRHCNNKLIGARYFASGLNRAVGQIAGDYGSARDHDGHGSHTASTAGGNRGVNPSIFGRDLGVATISGMAPRARIAAYKACFGDAGCALSDLVAAIDAAVADGVDVINYSIGSDSPSQLASDADAVAFLFAADAGVFVATSAGNAGPDASTVGSPADAPWVTAVGASTHSRVFQNTVTLGNAATFFGGSVTPGIAAQTRLVDGGEDCPEGLDAAQVTGAVVLCLRVTEIPRVEHGAGVRAAGGVGMILYDPPQVNVTPTDNHVLPTSTVSGPDGAAIAAYIESAGAAATANFSAGSREDRQTGTEMAVFSARGPNGAAADVIKPDVTAPGVQILAGNSPTPFIGAPDQLFQAIQGTSMSSPHVAGVGALLVGAHPNWTPAMIRSALTTTGAQDVFKEDGTTPADPFDFGGGYLAPLPAVDPGLVYDAGFNDYLRFLCGNGDLNPTGATCTSLGRIDPSDLNLATIGVGDLAGTQTVTRTVTNVGPAGTYDVVVDEPPGVDVVVTPQQLTLAAAASTSYEVTFSSEAGVAFDEWAFGSLTWTDGEHNVRTPLAVRPVPIAAPQEVSGTGTSGTLDYDVTFGYDGPFETPVHGLVPADVTEATVVDDPENEIAVALDSGVGINVHDIVVPAGTRHLRASLFDEHVDGETDDLDLYLFAPGEDPTDGDFVELSGTPTSNEQIDVVAPEVGTWKLVVHGWETDGEDATYDLFVWQVPDADAGNLAVTAPASATLGEAANIALTWASLAAGTRYLGIVGYSDGGTEFGGTLVSITT